MRFSPILIGRCVGRQVDGASLNEWMLFSQQDTTPSCIPLTLPFYTHSPAADDKNEGSSLSLSSASGGGKRLASSDKSFMYYVNDGVYGSFNCLLFDHAQAFPKVLTAGNRAASDKDVVSR